jgi:hypothetical protein
VERKNPAALRVHPAFYPLYSLYLLTGVSVQYQKSFAPAILG